MKASSGLPSLRWRRRMLWLAGALWTVFVAGLATVLVRSHTTDLRAHVDATASLRVSAVRDALQLTLNQLAALPTHLARQPAVAELLGMLDTPDQAGASEAQRRRSHESLMQVPQVLAMGRLLDRFVLDFDLPSALLLDRNGNVVASGRGRSNALPMDLAHNLRHRAYFASAMADGAAMQFAYGRVSGLGGIYFSTRILLDGVPYGVAVVRQSPAVLNQMLADADGSTVLVTDDNGVAILNNRKDGRLMRLPGGPGLTDAAWIATYNEVPPLLEWENSPGPSARGVTTVRFDGVDHALRSVSMREQPLKIWVLAPIGADPAYLSGTLAGSAGLWLAGSLLLWTGWRRRRSLDESLAARRELLAMTQSLPLTVFRYETRDDADPGRFTHLGGTAPALFGVDAATFETDPRLPWRVAGDVAQRPPVEPVEFAVRAGGRTVWLLAHAMPQRSAETATVYNGYWLDITARRETESRLAAVFEHAPNGYVFFDIQRGITHCNPAALQLFGVPDKAALLGRVLWFPGLSADAQPDGRPSRERALELMREHERSRARVQSTDWRFQRADGSPFDAEVSVIALEWQGAPEYCAVIQDVTLRKQAQAALLRARDVAESASRTKTSFLANMSHELRTPMNAIIGMTHLALEDGLAPRQRDYVGKAHQSARDLLQIVNDILDVSKIEAGQLELEQIDFELDAVIDAMADVLAQRAEEKGLELLFSATPDLPRRLVGDPTRLRQILVNLAGNAIKFTERGEVTLGMELASQEGERIELHIWVRDTGIGIGHEALGRLFQPFMQADTSTTRRFGGTGLGLAISRQLVEQMGGRLWVESMPGQGSTFHFTARFGRSAERALSRAWLAGELKDRRALLVDDNPAALDVLARMLEAIGIEVDRAASGEEALEKAARDGYAWILLDWKMPGMDGIECARRLLASRVGSQPSIVLVSAFGRDDAARAGAGLALDGVLQKPVTLSHLYDCLLEVRAAPHTASPGVRPIARRSVAFDDPLLRRLVGARVLLVEDHPLNQELACELLRRAGVEVAVADNGREALDRLEHDAAYDAVLMDCQMPVMDGYEATRTLRADPRWARLPVIAMTASAFADDRERAFASGMNGHITKPLDIEVMLRTLAESIGARPGRVARPGAASPPAPPAPPAPSAPSVSVAPDAVLDRVDGLARCLGKTDLYRRLLLGFKGSQAGFEADILAALDAQRWDEALRITHDLKGLAGTIGAHALQASIRGLEEGLAAHDADAARAGLARVGPDLAATLAEIDATLEAQPPLIERRG